MRCPGHHKVVRCARASALSNLEINGHAALTSKPQTRPPRLLGPEVLPGVGELLALRDAAVLDVVQEPGLDLAVVGRRGVGDHRRGRAAVRAGAAGDARPPRRRPGAQECHALVPQCSAGMPMPPP